MLRGTLRYLTQSYARLRFAAYKVPLQRGVYEQMQKGGHPVAKRLMEEQKHSILELWKRACSPPNSANRAELPDRCDRAWFINTFMGGPTEENAKLEYIDDVWPFIKSFNMYDPLCTIAVLAENEKIFDVEKFNVKGCEHQLIGSSKERPGIVDAECENLKEYMISAFLRSVEAPKLPTDDADPEEFIVHI